MVDVGVVLEELAVLSAGLDGSREQLGDALVAMRDVGVAPLGTRTLDGACAEFHDTWEFGLGKLSECVDIASGGIEETRKYYAAVEFVIAQALANMAAPLGPEASGR